MGICSLLIFPMIFISTPVPIPNHREIYSAYDLPLLTIHYEMGGNILFIVISATNPSYSIDYVEFYINDVLQFTDDAEPFEWIIPFHFYFHSGIKITAKAYTINHLILITSIEPKYYQGIITNLQEHTETYSAYAIILKTKPKKVYFLTQITLPKEYQGILRKHYIHATFFYTTHRISFY